MIAFSYSSPEEVCRAVAGRAKQARLLANFTQEGLATRAGVSLGSLKRLERIGAGSFEVLVRIALALRMEDGFEALFRPPQFKTLDDVIASKVQRHRGRLK